MSFNGHYPVDILHSVLGPANLESKFRSVKRSSGRFGSSAESVLSTVYSLELKKVRIELRTELRKFKKLNLRESRESLSCEHPCGSSVSSQQPACSDRTPSSFSTKVKVLASSFCNQCLAVFKIPIFRNLKL